MSINKLWAEDSNNPLLQLLLPPSASRQGNRLAVVPGHGPTWHTYLWTPVHTYPGAQLHVVDPLQGRQDRRLGH